MTKRELYEKLLQNPQRQIIKFLEEMSEVNKELCKFLNSEVATNQEEIKEELADVSITLEQMIILFSNEKEIKRLKLKKLKERFGKEITNEF